MRLRFPAVVLVALAVAAAACGDDDSSDTTAAAGEGGCAIDQLELVTEGTLTIATGEPAFPPWVEDDDPTSQRGFEAAVAYAVAGEMGFSDDQVTWVRTSFDDVIAPGPKDFDFNLQQFSITPVRQEVVDFSDPYYTTTQALVAFADSEVASVTSVADLAGYRLGASIGSTSFDFIEEVIQPDEDAAVYDSNANAKSALEAGQVDALVFDLPTAYFITAVEIPEATIVGQLVAPEAQADQLGLLFAKGNSLVSCVNAALGALRADGTLDDLAEQWLAQEGDIPTLSP
jgi:polar amino acid transport system substrate-binding protein